ncbi:hypothetical protein Tco_1432150 [Tanacetum coccineum]
MVTEKAKSSPLLVVRHFWEKNDTRGAIDALRKLPDHAVGSSRCGQYFNGKNGVTYDRAFLFLALSRIVAPAEKEAGTATTATKQEARNTAMEQLTTTS